MRAADFSCAPRFTSTWCTTTRNTRLRTSCVTARRSDTRSANTDRRQKSFGRAGPSRPFSLVAGRPLLGGFRLMPGHVHLDGDGSVAMPAVDAHVEAAVIDDGQVGIRR